MIFYINALNNTSRLGLPRAGQSVFYPNPTPQHPPDLTPQNTIKDPRTKARWACYCDQGWLIWLWVTATKPPDKTGDDVRPSSYELRSTIGSRNIPSTIGSDAKAHEHGCLRFVFTQEESGCGLLVSTTIRPGAKCSV